MKLNSRNSGTLSIPSKKNLQLGQGEFVIERQKLRCTLELSRAAMQPVNVKHSYHEISETLSALGFTEQVRILVYNF